MHVSIIWAFWVPLNAKKSPNGIVSEVQLLAAHRCFFDAGVMVCVYALRLQADTCNFQAVAAILPLEMNTSSMTQENGRIVSDLSCAIV